jgi:hypothetical protein
MAKEATPSDLISAGIKRSFAHHLIARTRKCAWPTALWLHDVHGLIIPQLSGLSDPAIAALRDIYPPRAPDDDSVMRKARAA